MTLPTSPTAGDPCFAWPLLPSSGVYPQDSCTQSSHRGSAETNLTSIHEDAVSIPDPTLWAVLQTRHRSGIAVPWHRPVAAPMIWGFGNLHMPWVQPLKRPKKKKLKHSVEIPFMSAPQVNQNWSDTAFWYMHMACHRAFNLADPTTLLRCCTVQKSFHQIFPTAKSSVISLLMLF